ncbi:MAG TPA: hypothetical protein VLX91_02595 [Candidatus Acidoferrales bacterium]|nr:hypothetical protein [Candidatus Acidoferrales bacterium]
MRRHFKRRFEFYYQSVAVYAVALILYAVIRGTFAESEFKLVFRDPIVYAFICVLIYSVVVLVVNMLFQRDVVVTDDFIILQNRFDSKTINLTELEWIQVGRPKRMKVRGSYRVIKMKLKNHLRAVRINPVHFHDEKGMMEIFRDLSGKINPTTLPKKRLRSFRRKNV